MSNDQIGFFITHATDIHGSDSFDDLNESFTFAQQEAAESLSPPVAARRTIFDATTILSRGIPEAPLAGFFF